MLFIKKLLSLFVICAVIITNIFTVSAESINIEFVESVEITDGSAFRIATSDKYVFAATGTSDAKATLVSVYDKETMAHLTDISFAHPAKVNLRAQAMHVKGNYLYVVFNQNSGSGDPHVLKYNIEEIKAGDTVPAVKTMAIPTKGISCIDDNVICSTDYLYKTITFYKTETLSAKAGIGISQSNHTFLTNCTNVFLKGKIFYGVINKNLHIYDASYALDGASKQDTAVYKGFITPGQSNVLSLEGKENFIYVSTVEGIYVYDMEKPKSPVKLGMLDGTQNSRAMNVNNGLLYAFCDSSLKIFSLETPENPYLIYEKEINNVVYGTNLSSGKIYTAEKGKISVYNVSGLEIEDNEMIPEEEEKADVSYKETLSLNASDICTDGKYLFALSEEENQINIYDKETYAQKGSIFKEKSGVKLKIYDMFIDDGKIHVVYDSVFRKYDVSQIESGGKIVETPVMPIYSDMAKEAANHITISDKYIFIAGANSISNPLINGKIFVYDKETYEYITAIWVDADSSGGADLPVRSMYISENKLYVSWNNAKSNATYTNTMGGVIKNNLRRSPLLSYDVAEISVNQTLTPVIICENTELAGSATDKLYHPYNRGGSSYLDEEAQLIYQGVYSPKKGQTYKVYDISEGGKKLSLTLTNGDWDCVRFKVKDGYLYEILQNNGGLTKTGTVSEEYNKIKIYDISNEENATSIDLSERLIGTYQTEIFGDKTINDIETYGDYFYIATINGVEVVGRNTLKKTSTVLGKNIYRIKAYEDKLFVAASDGVYVLSLTDNLKTVTSYNTDTAVYDLVVDVKEEKIYMTSKKTNAYGAVLDYTDTNITSYNTPFILCDKSFYGGTAGDSYFILAGGEGETSVNSLMAYSVPTKLKKAYITTNSGEMPDFVQSGNYFYETVDNTLKVYKIPSSDTTLENCLTHTYVASGKINNIYAFGGNIYVAKDDGLTVLDETGKSQKAVLYSGEEISSVYADAAFIYTVNSSGKISVCDTVEFKECAFNTFDTEYEIIKITVAENTLFLLDEEGNVSAFDTENIVYEYDVDIKTPEEKKVYKMTEEKGFPYIEFNDRIFSNHSLVAACDAYVVTAGKGDIKVYDKALNEQKTIDATEVSGLYSYGNFIAYCDNLNGISVNIYNLETDETRELIKADSGVMYADESIICVVDSVKNKITTFLWDGTLLYEISDVPQGVTKVYHKDSYLYLVYGKYLNIYDAQNLSADSSVSAEMLYKGKINPAETITSLSVTEDDYLYLAINASSIFVSRLNVYKLSAIKAGEENTASRAGTYSSVTDDPSGGRISDFVMRGDYLIADCTDAGEVQVINIQKRTAPYRESMIAKGTFDSYNFSDVDENGGKVYGIAQNKGLCLYNYTSFDIAEIVFVQNGKELYTAQNGDVTAKAKVYNESGKNIEGTLVFAVYEGGRLKFVTKTDVLAENGKETVVYTENINLENDKNYTVKAMLLDSIADLKPLSKHSESVEADQRERIIYVDSNADFPGSGSKEAPFKTIEDAKDAVRKINKAMSSDITIEIAGGRYDLSKPLEFNETDSGFNGYKVIYKAKEGEKPIISGGSKIEGWTLYDSEKGIYKADAKGIRSRQLTVDGERAVRAKSKGALTKASWSEDRLGIYCYNDEICYYKNIKDLELVFNNNYKSKRAGVDAVYKIDSNGKVFLTVNSPFNNVISGSGSYVVPSYYENALELLDEENEFYLDATEDVVYYKPKAGKDINLSEIYAPVLEELFVFCGSGLYRKAKNIEIEGLEFTDTTWMMPTENGGFYPTQANYYSSPNGGTHFIIGSPVKNAVRIEQAENLKISNCTIKNTGANAIGIVKASKNINISDNTIENISATGVLIGEADVADANPKDVRKRIENIVVSNNYIDNTACEYFASCAVTVGTSQNVEITHNEISNTPYSAIHIGWGWDSFPKRNITGLKVEYNYIHNVVKTLQDGGAIYTTGMTLADCESSPNSISYNYIKDVESGGLYASAAIYLDTGSSGYLVKNNVVDLSTCNTSWVPRWSRDSGSGNKFEGNFTTTDVGDDETINTMVSPNASWGKEAAVICENAGVKK